MSTNDLRSMVAIVALAAAVIGAGISAAIADDMPWRQAAGPAEDAYQAPPSPSDGAYSDDGTVPADDSYRPEAGPGDGQRDSFSDPGSGRSSGSAYGEAYAPPPDDIRPYDGGEPTAAPDAGPRYYEQGEIVAAGHGFFGSVTKGLASAVESVFKSQGRPNGYVLGEDAGGALIIGLRYGEGTLYTKDAGTHKVFWQGPTLGYDAGAEGSKTMILVYNLKDPGEIYERFGGVQGSAYLIGGVSVQYQQYNDVRLAIIRSGLGLRLGANVGYAKYTRAPTWNPL